MRAFERLAAACAIAVVALASAAPTGALYTASTTNPANALTTAVTGVWFGATGSGVTICAGRNSMLACPFGTLTAVGKYDATFSLQTKTAALSYTVAVLDGAGPAPISTIVSVSFASTGSTTATIAAGATDTVNVQVKLKGGTPRGTYTGLVVLTETATGAAATIPLSITYV